MYKTLSGEGGAKGGSKKKARRLGCAPASGDPSQVDAHEPVLSQVGGSTGSGGSKRSSQQRDDGGEREVSPGPSRARSGCIWFRAANPSTGWTQAYDKPSRGRIMTPKDSLGALEGATIEARAQFFLADCHV